MPVYIHRAHAAYSFAAVMVECNGVFVLTDELLVQDVHHLEERCTLEDVLEFIGLEMTFCLRSCLSPDANLNVNVAVHVYCVCVKILLAEQRKTVSACKGNAFNSFPQIFSQK